MILTWVILLPVDAAKARGTGTGIEMFTFGNVGNATARYAAHLIIVWILTCASELSGRCIVNAAPAYQCL